MEPQSHPKSNKKLAGIIGLVVIVAAIGVGAFAFSGKKPADNTVAEATPTPTTLAATAAPDSATATPAASSSATASAYKDGTYKASGSYDSPGGDETVNVTLTLKDGVVTDSTVTTSGNNPTGKMYQAKFVSGYKSQVTGKSIDSITLTKVSGSSLTPEGFNNAVAKIKTEAKA